MPSPTQVKLSTFAVDVACGAEFSMVVDINGSVYSFGCPEYGQLGNILFYLLYLIQQPQLTQCLAGCFMVVSNCTYDLHKVFVMT